MSDCNGCDLERLKKKYGARIIKVGGSWYLKNEEPAPGQSKPLALPDGTPIRFMAWYMSEEHSH